MASLKSKRRGGLVPPALVACLAVALASAPADAKASPASRPTPDIVEEWPAHLAFLLMMGAQDRVLSADMRQGSPGWLRRYFPLKAFEANNIGEPDVEALLRRGARIAFLPSGRDVQARQWEALGLRAYSYPAMDYAGLLDCVKATADVLDTPQARRRALDYRADMTDVLADLAVRPSEVPLRYGGRRPKILHIASLNPLLVDGRDTLIDQWIIKAGGRNATAETRGNRRPADWEQVQAWNPDIVILQADAGDPDKSAGPAGRAFLAGRVMRRNPTGIFSWDRYGPEALLQLRWAAEIVAGAPIDDAPWIARIRDFYRKFYGADVSAEDARRMLRGLPPAE